MFSWLLEVVEDSSDLWDGGRIVWSVRYVLEGPENGASFVRGGANIRQLHGGRSHHVGNGRSRPLRDGILEENRRKLTARLEIQKDDIQSVLPISKVSQDQLRNIEDFFYFHLNVLRNSFPYENPKNLNFILILGPHST